LTFKTIESESSLVGILSGEDNNGFFYFIEVLNLSFIGLLWMWLL